MPTPTPTSPETVLPGLWSLVPFAWVGLLVLVVLLIATLSIAPLRARAYRKAATINESERKQWRERVIDFVSANSPAKGDQVSLVSLWKRSGLTAADRFVVLEPLLKSHVLKRAYSSDGATNFLQTLFWTVPGRPPRYVQLSERDWTQMASGAKAQKVIKKQVVKKTVTKTTLGDVTGSAVAIGAHAKATNRVRPLENLSPESAQLLVAALRSDALSLPRGAAEDAASAADALESDVRAGRVENALQRANALVDLAMKGSELGSKTAAVLQSLGALG